MNIAVLLSGGVDSSVVVHLLCEQGYRPSLFYIKIGMDGAEFMVSGRRIVRLGGWFGLFPAVMACLWR